MSYDDHAVRHIGDNGFAPSWGAMSPQTFTTKVMPAFGGSLLVAAGGVAGGFALLQAAPGLAFPALIGAMITTFVMALTAGWWQSKPGLNVALFFVYALLSGATLVPLLAWAGMRGGLPIIAQALTVTAITFGGLSVYGMTTKRDFSNLGGFIFVACLALLFGGLLNVFVFHSSVFTLVASLLSVGIFSAFTVFEMNMIRNTYADSEWIGAALGLFIAFIGLFQSILRVFGLMGGNDD